MASCLDVCPTADESLMGALERTVSADVGEPNTGEQVRRTHCTVFPAGHRSDFRERHLLARVHHPARAQSSTSKPWFRYWHSLPASMI